MNEVTNTVHGGADVQDSVPMSVACEVWAAAQLSPGEGIEDGVARVQAILAKVGEPVAWMLRDQRGNVHWDGEGCVFYNEKDAQREADGMYDGDGDVWSAFALYAAPPSAEPAQPVDSSPCLAALRMLADADVLDCDPATESEAAARAKSTAYDVLLNAEAVAQPTEAVDERAAFEAWARSEGHSCDRSELGDYVFGATHSAWKGWHAALARCRPSGDETLEKLRMAIESQITPRKPPSQAEIDAQEALSAKVGADPYVGQLASKTAPTVDQAGEVVAWRWRSPAEVEYGKGWNLTTDPEFAAMLLQAEGHQVEPLSPPRTVAVPDGWRLMPEMPTEPMLEAGWPYPDVRDFDRKGAYADLWAAAPAPGKGGEA